MTTRLTLPLCVALLAVLLAVGITVASPEDEKTTRLSLTEEGDEINDASANPAVTPDGRFLVYDSPATNLVVSDTNGVSDVFVYDLVGGTIERVSVASDGTEANAPSQFGAISSDGRYVVFESEASNLDDRDSVTASDIFMHDRETGSTVLISYSLEANQGGGSFAPDISEDGNVIVFHSTVSGLVKGDTNGVADIFAYYPASALMVCITACQGGDGDSRNPVVTATGNVIAFESEATNLVPGDTNNVQDVFIWAPGWGEIQRISESLSGDEANGISSDPSISRNGRQIAFTSQAPNLVPGDSNEGCLLSREGNCDDVFVRSIYPTYQDLNRVSVGGAGEANGSSFDADISADGNWVIFRSSATNLMANDTNEHDDVFVVNRVTYTIALASMSMEGNQANRNSLSGVLGQGIEGAMFVSPATNLVDGDTNGVADIFLHEFEMPIITATPAPATPTPTITPGSVPSTATPTSIPPIGATPTLPPPPPTVTVTSTPSLDIDLFLPVLLVRSQCVAEEIEPNNGYANATSIGACKNIAVSGSFPPDTATDNQDVYKLTLTGPGQLVVDLTGIPAGNDYELVLYGENGQSHPTLDESRNSGNAAEQVQYTLPVGARVYYLQVFRVVGYSDDAYTLRWRVQ